MSFFCLFVLTTCTIALVLDDAEIDTMTGPGSISRNCGFSGISFTVVII